MLSNYCEQIATADHKLMIRIIDSLIGKRTSTDSLLR